MNLRLSNSKVKTWRRCPKQYEYKYVQGLRPKAKALPLERGSWLHDLLMHHYDGEGWKAQQAKKTAEFNALWEEEREELGDLPSETQRIMTSYLMRYGKEDQPLRVIDSELDEIITLPNGLRFQVIIDLIVEEPDGGIWLWDHKTVAQFMPADFMLLDAQLARYFWAAEYMGYKPLRGILFNELKTKAPTLPDVLKSTGRLTERKNLRCDVYSYYREIKRLGQDPASYAGILNRLKSQQDDWFRRTRLPKDKPLTQRLMDELHMSAREILRAEEKGEYPRTVEKDCVWSCSYLEPCSIELMGGDISNVVKAKYDVKKKEKDL